MVQSARREGELPKRALGYHRSTWPRRTRCKEGNLSFFYNQFGYREYDFVVQMDADHVPQKGYLEEMLRPFCDPRLGTYLLQAYVIPTRQKAGQPAHVYWRGIISWSTASRLH